MKINGKVIVVSGGGSGIGRELVLATLKKGARVAAVDISQAGLEETARLAGNPAGLSTHVVDISDRAAVEALPEAVLGAHGAVDGIINNAGIIQPFVRYKDLTLAQIERVMNINFYGTLYMTGAFLPHLLQRPEAHILNVASMGSFVPVPGQTLYGASKAAVKLFTEGLHSELKDSRVHVTLAVPGATSTNIAVNSGVMSADRQSAEDAKFKTTPADVAALAMLDAMENNRYSVLIGSDTKTMDFLHRLMPERAARIIYNQMKSLLPG